MTRKAEERMPRKNRKAEAPAGVEPERTPARRTPARRPPARRPRRRADAAGTVPAATPAPEPVVPQVPPEHVLEVVNRAYYDAFQSLDLDQMDRMWWHDDRVMCIHPGWDARHGWPDVRKTFEDVFANTKSIRFALGDVRVRVAGDVAWVTCVENLVSEEGGSGDYLGAVLATNLFERRHGEWRLVLHHTSPFSSEDAELPEGPLH